ncbi:alpha/beta hydrolase fold [Geodermatophilus obscurus]|uniref:Alpha/beta hydrolase fold n=1 Tax=Geodermatophilus obscurus TaxID=1861 RepID=A0A1M7UPA7_9ACTN|nr:alpha/beta hydrolase [Geodermatophilus obscurus]SHN84851.1 alpha/beta hydrolase fold [Geodermatophilus obscurus]
MPDLRGHGRSTAEPPYGYAVHAADVASLVAESGAARVTVLGHSFGGVVGAVLAGGWFGVEVERVVAVGVKIDWTADEKARARSMATRPPQVFPTAAEAADRHLRLAGLTGLVDPSSEVAAAGVREVDGGFTAALDPLAFGLGGPRRRLVPAVHHLTSREICTPVAISAVKGATVQISRQAVDSVSEAARVSDRVPRCPLAVPAPT